MSYVGGFAQALSRRAQFDRESEFSAQEAEKAREANRKMRAEEFKMQTLTRRQEMMPGLIQERRAAQQAAMAEVKPYYDYFQKRGVDPSLLGNYGPDALKTYYTTMEKLESEMETELTPEQVITFMNLEDAKPSDRPRMPGEVEFDLATIMGGDANAWDPSNEFVPGVSWDAWTDLNTPLPRMTGSDLANTDFSVKPMTNEDIKAGRGIFDSTLEYLFQEGFNPDNPLHANIVARQEAGEPYIDMLEQAYGQQAYDMLYEANPTISKNPLIHFKPSAREEAVPAATPSAGPAIGEGDNAVPTASLDPVFPDSVDEPSSKKESVPEEVVQKILDENTSYEDWQSMSREQREEKGLPVSTIAGSWKYKNRDGGWSVWGTPDPEYTIEDTDGVNGEEIAQYLADSGELTKGDVVRVNGEDYTYDGQYFVDPNGQQFTIGNRE